MMKKEYQAPKMEIVDFNLQNTILCGSGEEESCDAEYCDEIGFDIRGSIDHKA